MHTLTFSAMGRSCKSKFRNEEQLFPDFFFFTNFVTNFYSLYSDIMKSDRASHYHF